MTTGTIDQLLVRVDADTRGLAAGMQRSSAATQQASQKMATSLKAADASVKQVDASVKRMDATLKQTVRTTDQFGRQLNTGARGSARMGNAIQQAGFQVGDFATQVASGQGVLRPFIQQGTQLVSMFGPWGAVIGAAGAVVGALAIALTDSGDAAEDAAEEHEKLQQELERVAKEAEETKKRIEELANAEEQLALKTARSTASIAARNELGLAQRLANAESDPIQAQRAYIDNQQKIFDGFINELGVLEQVAQRDRDLEEQRSRHVRNYTDSLREELRVKQLSEKAQQVEAALAEARNAAREEGRDLTEEEAAEVARLTSELAKLEREQNAATKAAAAAQRQSAKNTQAMQRQGQAAAKLIRNTQNENRVLAERIRFGENAADALQREIRQREALGPLYEENSDRLRELNAANDNLTEALERQQEQQRETERAAREAAASMERDIERATDSIVDALEGVLFEGDNVFGSLANLAKRAFADMAANAIIRPVIQPVVAGAVGGTAGGATLFGGGGGLTVPGYAGGTITAGGGGIAHIGSLVSGGLTSPFLGNLGQDIAFSLGLGPTASNVLSDALAFSPGGAIGSFAASALGLGSGNMFIDAGLSTVGSLAGGAIGGSIGGTVLGIGAGPIGAVAGGFLGQALGGLFGNDIGTPRGHTNLALSGGRVRVGASGQDNEFDPSGTQQQVAQLAQVLNSFADQFGLQIVGTRGAPAISGGDAPGPQTVQAALDGFFANAASNLRSDSAAVNRALASFTDMDSLANAIGQINTAEDAIAALARALDASTDPIDQITSQFESLRATALQYGLDVATIDRAIRAEIDAFNMAQERTNLGIESAVLQQVGNELASIQSFQLNRQISGSATPLDRVSAAQSAVQASLDAVREGNTGAVSSLLQNAGTLLNVGADAFGTATPQFAALERMVDSTVASAARLVGSEQTVQDRISAAIDAQTASQEQSNETLIRQVEGLRSDVRRLTRQLADQQAA